ncbi:BON domain-containing protein [Roseateles asaccharophilus]|uniref:Hyperosmotically inducible protein n=1 Tax=Roseateles asaccharophilus TaxID=582607 RepID=A0ABU2ADJ0_9BURK|nr:BON domain-containing protein [Roseateles asaccharophilus]MDR7335272.1 hyperosmotically inducible protein [Roseateles asaccharophilus]
MKLSRIASLVIVGAMVAPLAVQANDATKTATAKTWVKDSVVTTKIKAQLAASKVTSLVNVQVDTDANGHVQLTGKVKTQAEKDRADSIAKAVEGVKSVDNQLTVTPT